MPDRYLRSAILMSEPVNSLSVHAELFYRRLMSVVDDFGRYEANPAVLLPACYPMQLNTRKADISRWLTECEQAGLILLYDVEGKAYVWMLKTETPRAQSSKYPPHPSDDRHCIFKPGHSYMCAHVRARAPDTVPVPDSVPRSRPPNGGVGGIGVAGLADRIIKTKAGAPAR
jgi:hypothetical protein